VKLTGIFGKFMKYSSVASGSVAVDWIVFIIISILGGTYILCQALSRIAGGVFSFLANRYWSFSSKDSKHITVQGRRFILLYCFSYALSLGLMYFFVAVIHFPVYGTKLGSDALCFLVNFVVMHNYVYSRREGLLSSTNNVVGTIFKKGHKIHE